MFWLDESSQQAAANAVLAALDAALVVWRGERPQLDAGSREVIEAWLRSGGQAWVTIDTGEKRGLLEAIDEKLASGGDLRFVTVVKFLGGSLDGTTRRSPGLFARKFVKSSVFDGLRAVETYVRSDTEWEGIAGGSSGEGRWLITMELDQLQVVS